VPVAPLQTSAGHDDGLVFRTTKVISGTMPKWQQNGHAFGFWSMCVLFTAFGLFNVRLLLHAWESGAPRPALFFSFLFIAFVCVAIGGQVSFRRRIVKEFTYDGYTLQFSTLGTAMPQTRALSEIAGLREWKGRGGSFGYRIAFRDGKKIYLQYGIPNAVAAAADILRNVG
jgi:hypothetical protein